MFEFPLAFGNVTLAATILVVTYLVLCAVVQIGIEIIAFTLGMDDENSLIKKPKNKLCNIPSKIQVFVPRKVINLGGGYGVKSLVPFNYIDMKETKFSWSKGDKYYDDCTTHNKSRAEDVANTFKVLNIKPLFIVLIIDLFILMLSISFIPTVVIGGLIATIFSVRTLAKKFYKTAAEGKSRLDGHDKDIQELKDTANEK